MTYSPEFQQNLSQQQPASQLPPSQLTATQSEQPMGTTEAITPTPLSKLDPTVLLPYGGIAVAVILAITVLILALAEYNKVFVSAMLQSRDDE